MKGGRVGSDRMRSRTPSTDPMVAAADEILLHDRRLRAELEQTKAALATVAEIAHEALDGWESLAPIANDETELARIAELRAQLPPPREQPAESESP